MINTIPGTDCALPTPWDLLQSEALTGLPEYEACALWIRAHHGEAAALAWWEAGCPRWAAPPAPPADQGVIRRSWHRGRYH